MPHTQATPVPEGAFAALGALLPDALKARVETIPVAYPTGWWSAKERWHFLRRLYLRYDGLVLEFGEYQEIVDDIIDDKATLIRQWVERECTIYQVKHRRTGRDLQVAIDHMGVPITALRPGSYYRRGRYWHQLSSEVADREYVPPVRTTEWMQRLNRAEQALHAYSLQAERDRDQRSCFIRYIQSQLSRDDFNVAWERAREMFPDHPCWDEPLEGE